MEPLYRVNASPKTKGRPNKNDPTITYLVVGEREKRQLHSQKDAKVDTSTLGYVLTTGIHSEAARELYPMYKPEPVGRVKGSSVLVKNPAGRDSFAKQGYLADTFKVFVSEKPVYGPAPSIAPSFAPSTAPTSAPTSRPTSLPTHVPTSVPTGIPTNPPTSYPTHGPTGGDEAHDIWETAGSYYDKCRVVKRWFPTRLKADQKCYTKDRVVYSYWNYKVDYRTANLRGGDYKLTLRYDNWPPGSGTRPQKYDYRVRVTTKGMSKIVTLPYGQRSKTIDWKVRPGTQKVTVQWLNDTYKPTFDTNLALDSLKLEKKGRPAPR